MIAEQTRAESYIKTSKVQRRLMVKAVLEKGDYTSREIMKKLHFVDGNQVKPRISELKAAGIIEAVGKKFDPETERNVAVWHLVENC